MNSCECGCGIECKKRFVHNHQKRNVHLSVEHKIKLRLAGLGRKQSKETIEKRVAKIRGIACSENTKSKISETLKKYEITKVHRDALSKSKYGRVLSEEHKNAIRLNRPDFSGNKHPMYGKHHSESTRIKMSLSQKGKKHLYAYKFSEKDKVKISIARKSKKLSEHHIEALKKSWNNPEVAARRLFSILRSNFNRPNKSETRLSLLLSDLNTDFKYVGNGSFIIDHKNPDFVNKESKKIIELQGCYWHGCKICFPNSKKSNNFPDRQQIFKPAGYDSIEIWEHELKSPEVVISKVKDFNSLDEIEKACKEQERISLMSIALHDRKIKD
ncbi:hypothetical protein HYS94_01850 [Candidatus Daviesbacteria bacterium]|nr:hypothetical protein [Candidatus Daviesbacteria bacterium]